MICSGQGDSEPVLLHADVSVYTHIIGCCMQSCNSSATFQTWSHNTQERAESVKYSSYATAEASTTNLAKHKSKGDLTSSESESASFPEKVGLPTVCDWGVSLDMGLEGS